MSQAPALTVTNGLLVLPEAAPRRGGIRCEGGRIVALGDVAAQPGDVTLDARARWSRRGWSTSASSRSTSPRSTSAGSPARR